MQLFSLAKYAPLICRNMELVEQRAGRIFEDHPTQSPHFLYDLWRQSGLCTTTVWTSCRTEAEGWGHDSWGQRALVFLACPLVYRRALRWRHIRMRRVGTGLEQLANLPTLPLGRLLPRAKKCQARFGDGVFALLLLVTGLQEPFLWPNVCIFFSWRCEVLKEESTEAKMTPESRKTP